jgi:long-chain acyl-CoA synthetase
MATAVDLSQTTTVPSAPPTPPAGATARTYAYGGPRVRVGTVNELFFHAVETFDRPNALQVRRDGRYLPISHRELLQHVQHISFGLTALGVHAGDRVAILSENRPEWVYADYGCLTIGITDVPIYPTLPAEQMPYLINDSGAEVIFLSTEAQAAKIASIRDRIPAVRHVIGFGPMRFAGCDMTLAEFEALGAQHATPERLAAHREQALAIAPESVATLIYTSGTTGDPKGVMLTHDNFYSNALAGAEAIQFRPTDTALSFLPLSHVFERCGDYMLFSQGVGIAYADSIDTVAQNMGEVQPSIMMSVPRLYEKIYAKVLEGATTGSPLKQKIFYWARGVGDAWANERLAGRTPGGLLALQYRLATKLVFSKLQARTGGRMRYFVSGGAPLSPEINKFFYAAGLTILEGYGLTETSPVIAVNTPAAFRIGTVGPPIKGAEVWIAPDGEICTRGPQVMKGYYNKPEATAEVIDADGWFKTGDIGVLEDGFLRITDRKKDIIVTAGGKNIAPQPIENRVKTNRFVSQAVMIGDKRKFPIMLVVPNADAAASWAGENGRAGATLEQLVADADFQSMMDQQLRSMMSGLASFEMPKKFGYLGQEFSIERGELTPKLSVKRRVVDVTYKAVIDRLYADGD